MHFDLSFNYLNPFFVSEFELGSQWPIVIKDFKQALPLTANNPLQHLFFHCNNVGLILKNSPKYTVSPKVWCKQKVY